MTGSAFKDWKRGEHSNASRHACVVSTAAAPAILLPFMRLTDRADPGAGARAQP